MAETVRIEIPIETIDETTDGLNSAINGLRKLERAYSNLGGSANHSQQRVSAFDRQAEKTESRLSRWLREKHELVLEARDRISPILQMVGRGVKSLTGKPWSVTMKAIDLVTAPVRGIMRILSNPIFQMGAVLGVSIGLKDTIDTYKNFESAMSKVQAISGATGNNLDKLTKKAEQLGETTKFTAQEVAEGFNYMAMAGWKTDDMISGIDGILSLSAASGEELSTVSDIVTDGLTAFRMGADKSNEFADVIAAASSNANTNVSMMGETFKYAGTMAGSLGYSIQDVALAAGLMANSGIKASMAGTSLNSIFTRLATNAGGSSKQMGALDLLTKKLGVQFYDSHGNARKLSNVLSELRQATKGLNDEEKSFYAKKIAGMEAQKGLLAILNATEDEYKSLKEAIDNSEGAAGKMADTMMDNLQGSITKLQSAVDGVKISLGKRLSPYVKGIAEWLTDQMPAIKNGLNSLMDWVDLKIESAKKKFKEITNSFEWQDADFFGKVHILWDEFITDPFSEWWQSTGKFKFAAISENIGHAIGTGLKVGILTLLGIDVSETIDEGASIGASFAKGFTEGLDFGKISEKLWEGLGNVFNNASKFIPGGESPDLSSLMSLLLIGKMAGPLMTLGRGTTSLGRGLVGAGRGVAPLLSKIIGTTGNQYVQGTGLLNVFANAGYGLSGGASSAGGYFGAGTAMSGGAAAALGGTSILGGVLGAAGLIHGGFDLYEGFTSNDEARAEAYKKAGAIEVGGTLAGAGAGAATGAAIGMLGGPIGAGAGALIGAGVGAIGSFFAAKKVKDEYEENSEEMRKAAYNSRKIFELTGKDIKDVTFKSKELTEAMKDSEVSAEQMAAMIQEKSVETLSDAFGDIHLSLGEIKTLASEITLGKLKNNIDEFSKATDNANASLNDLHNTLSAVKKGNWKVGLGLKLTKSEKQEYKDTLKNYVETAKTYLENSHYEATTAISMFVDDNDKIKGLDNMYAVFQAQVDDYGTQMYDYLKTSLTDNISKGVIDTDEMKIIEVFQKKISDITDKVSNAKEKTALQAIGIKYSGAELDSETFLALQSEIAAYQKQAMESYDQGMETALLNLNLSHDEGYTTDNEYFNAVEEIKRGRQKHANDISNNANDFELEALLNSGFGKRLDNIMPYSEGDAKEKLQQALNNAMIAHPEVEKWENKDIAKWFELDSSFKDYETQNAVAELLKNVALGNTSATKEDLIKKYKQTIPTSEEIYNAIDWSNFNWDKHDEIFKLLNPDVFNDQTTSIGVKAEDTAKNFKELYGGNVETMAKNVSESMHNTMVNNIDPEAMKKVVNEYFDYVTVAQPNQDKMQETGTATGSKFNEGLTNELLNSADLYRTSAETAINSAFSNPFNVTANINVTPNYNMWQKSLPLLSTPQTSDISQHAAGGYVSGGPQLSWLAEEGWGEFVIPTNPSRRSDAIELYEQAGRALGVSQHAAGGYVEGQYSDGFIGGNNYITNSLKNESRAYTETASNNYETQSVAVPTSQISYSEQSVTPNVQVSVNVSPEFNISGEEQSENDILSVIKRHITEIADELGGEIADKLGEVFSNMPLKG